MLKLESATQAEKRCATSPRLIFKSRLLLKIDLMAKEDVCDLKVLYKVVINTSFTVVTTLSLLCLNTSHLILGSAHHALGSACHRSSAANLQLLKSAWLICRQTVQCCRAQCICVRSF